MKFIFNHLAQKCTKKLEKEPRFELYGIKILDDETYIGYEDTFKKTITNALNLLYKHDNRRFKKVTDTIEWISDSPVPEEYSGLYTAYNKGCIINFQNKNDDLLIAGAYYAGTLIKVAIQGKIMQRNIKVTKQDNFRIFKMCAIASNRFWKIIEHAYPEYKGRLVVEYDFKELQKTAKPRSKFVNLYRSLKRMFATCSELKEIEKKKQEK